MFTKTIEIQKEHSGIIIGKKGANIKKLGHLPGVVRVDFNTKGPAPRGTYTLLVRGSNPESCDLALELASKLIVSASDPYKTAKMSRIYLGINEVAGEAIFRKITNPKEVPVLLSSSVHSSLSYLTEVRTDNICTAAVRTSSSEEVLPTRSFLIPYSTEDALRAVKESLEGLYQGFETRFNVSPGKELFINRTGQVRTSLTLSGDGNSNDTKLNAINLQPFWNSFALPGYREKLVSILRKDGFELLSKDEPHNSTIVHLHAGPENLFASVKLAVDKDLKQVEPSKDDRLTKEKKDAVENVLRARTLGEVIPDKSKKLGYRRLSLLVHPDKSSHPGATEAFKKVIDAFNRFTKDGGREGDKALSVDFSPGRKENVKPPKVVNVKTSRLKPCTLTMATTSGLDIRGRIVCYKENTDLAERIRAVLNSCWDRMDPQGGIADPEGNTGITVSMIKQVTSAYSFGKEVDFHGRKEVLVFEVNQIRLKQMGYDWEECVEIDIFVDTEDLSPASIVQKFEFIKDFWYQGLKGCLEDM